jgi:hypothetical protein
MSEIMLNFLNLNPYFRMTAYQCLKNCRIFDSIRNQKNEEVLDYIQQQVNKVRASSNQKRAAFKTQMSSKTTSKIHSGKESKVFLSLQQ